MIKITPKGKQALKEFSKSKAQKYWLIEVAFYIAVLILSFIFLWQYYQLLYVLVVVIAGIIGTRFSKRLKSFKGTASVGGKIQKEITK